VVLPGFTAESSLDDAQAHYRSLSHRRACFDLGVAQSEALVLARAIHGVSCAKTCRQCGPFGLFDCDCRVICTDPSAGLPAGAWR
jgi:hypothetical protein